MKRLATLFLAAGMIFGCSTGNAGAIELTANGTFEFGWSWNEFLGKDKTDTFNAAERIRPQFNFIASENLKGVLRLEIGKGFWGGKNGFAMGADGINVKTKSAYVDWVVPGADMKVRMGLMPLGQPRFTFSASVYDSESDTAGIAMNYQFNDSVGLSLAWARPYNDETVAHDAVDIFMLSVPVTGDGFKVTPWGIIAGVGEGAVSGSWSHSSKGGAASPWGGNLQFLGMGLAPYGMQDVIGDKTTGTAWWLGIGGELTMFDPFRFALDFVYGSVDMGDGIDKDGRFVDLKRSGWSVAAQMQYKMDFMTPGLIFWYSSGDDSNPYDGSERLPFLYPRSESLTLAYDANPQSWMDGDYLGSGDNGVWAIGLRLDDITFIDKLKHDLRLGYIRGTNNTGMAAQRGGIVLSPFAGSNYDSVYLTTADSAWEIDFNTRYDIYKNLTMRVELCYLKLNLDEATWGNYSSSDESSYKAAVYMVYKF